MRKILKITYENKLRCRLCRYLIPEMWVSNVWPKRPEPDKSLLERGLHLDFLAARFANLKKKMKIIHYLNLSTILIQILIWRLFFWSMNLTILKT